MNVRRFDETWHLLLEWTMEQAPSERMAALILDEEGFESIDPAHPLGGRDGGESSEPLAHVGEGVEVLVGDPARSQHDPVVCGSTRAPNVPNAVSASMATARSF